MQMRLYVSPLCCHVCVTDPTSLALDGWFSSAVAVAAYPCGQMVKNNCLLTPERLFSARVGALI